VVPRVEGKLKRGQKRMLKKGVRASDNILIGGAVLGIQVRALKKKMRKKKDGRSLIPIAILEGKKEEVLKTNKGRKGPRKMVQEYIEGDTGHISKEETEIFVGGKKRSLKGLLIEREGKEKVSLDGQAWKGRTRQGKHLLEIERSEREEK